MSTHVRPSGLIIVDTEAERAAIQAAESTQPTGIKCAKCDRRSVDEHIFLYRTSDGFKIHHPVCHDGPYIVCPDCRTKEPFGCPVCGTLNEYT